MAGGLWRGARSGELFEPVVRTPRSRRRALVKLRASVHDAVSDGVDGRDIPEGLLQERRRSQPVPTWPAQMP